MESAWRDLADDIGPAKVVLVRDPAVGLRGIVVVDNVACGPAVGGIRMAPDITVSEVARLARAMTYKNAAAGLSHGGAKGGIIAESTIDAATKERLIRAYARGIRDLVEYVPGPDMGTDESCMAYIHDEIGRAVGLPWVLGGIPLDRIGATGFGLAICAEVAQRYAGIELPSARVAIQGFGAVGSHAARFLAARGCVVVGVCDARAAILNPRGLDLEALTAHKDRNGTVAGFAGGQEARREEIVGVDCDIWIPAARPDVLHADNVGQLKARLVLQGANIPATPDAETLLHERGILSVPDFIANAGGVICASVEYRHGTEHQAFEVIEEKIRANTESVLAAAKRDRLSPREAAVRMAKLRVEEAMRYRRHGART